LIDLKIALSACVIVFFVFSFIGLIIAVNQEGKCKFNLLSAVILYFAILIIPLIVPFRATMQREKLIDKYLKSKRLNSKKYKLKKKHLLSSKGLLISIFYIYIKICFKHFDYIVLNIFSDPTFKPAYERGFLKNQNIVKENSYNISNEVISANFITFLKQIINLFISKQIAETDYSRLCARC
jgi:hypothetical protein